jgi:hypothetical protein
MSTAAQTRWQIAGDELANCNCAWGCPCQFNANPTTGHCEALVTFRIARGHYGDVKMDGVTFSCLVYFPGALHEGNGTLQMVIDETTSSAQRQALHGMASGKQGGLFFEIIAAICPNILDTIYAPISFTYDQEKRVAAVRISGIAESVVEPIKNPVTGEEHRARIVLPKGFEYKEAEMGNTVRFKVTSGPKLQMEHANTYAQLNRFDWSN